MSWERFQHYYQSYPELGFALDISRIDFPENFLNDMAELIAEAFTDMEALEGGAISNPDENRMVGHYWLRDAALAPTPALTADIESTLTDIQAFVAGIHSGAMMGIDGKFDQLLIIGIGGSALGPQFVAQALGNPSEDNLSVAFFDNTDPDGLDLTLERLKGKLGTTLVVVISKSGGTPETRNGMLEAKAAFEAAGIPFASQAVAITGTGSKLDQLAESEGWLARFPMWDWVGGRTSETGPVGLIPAALQGLDINGMLSGAKAMDGVTRQPDAARNPAMLLALMWFFATDGQGSKDMVVLPYKDRLELFSRYLQQLVMESLGKEKDLDGNVVHQGIAVYGNKGSTDQHAYVQQLREGVPNFFAVFIEVLQDRSGDSIEVEPGITSGDFLHGFFLGTRDALYENERQSVTLTINAVTSESVGMLIALFERAVGFYASLININAYHQPGVEAGKKAAASVLDLQTKVLAGLDDPSTAAELAQKLGLEDQTEWVFKCLSRLAKNGRVQVEPTHMPPAPDAKFSA